MPRNPLEFHFVNCNPQRLVELIDGDYRRHLRRLWGLGVLLVTLLLVGIASVFWLLWLLVRA